MNDDRNQRNGRKGTGTVEYSVLCLGIVLIIIVAVRQMGANTSASFLNTSTVVANVVTNGPVTGGTGGEPK